MVTFSLKEDQHEKRVYTVSFMLCFLITTLSIMMQLSTYFEWGITTLHIFMK